MGSSKKTTSTNQTSTQTPYGNQYLDYGLGELQNWYQGGGPTAFGSMVAPMNPLVHQSLQGIAQRAQAGSPLEAAAQQTALQGMGAFSPAQGFLTGQMYNPYSGAGIAQPFAYGDVAAARAPNPAAIGLQNTASGQYLNANPYLNQMFDAQADAIGRQYSEITAPTTAANFSLSGRLRGGNDQTGAYGSQVGRNEAELLRGLGNIGANVYGQNYQMERGLQEAANRDFGQLALQQLAAQRAATGQLGNIGQAQQGAQMGAAGMLGNQYFQGMGQNLQSALAGADLAGLDYQNLARLGQAGQGYMNQQERQLADAARIHDFYQTGPGSQLSMLQSFFGPTLQAGQLGGTTTGQSTQTETYKPGTMDYLGMAANVAGAAMGAPTGTFSGMSNFLGGGGGSPYNIQPAGYTSTPGVIDWGGLY